MTARPERLVLGLIGVGLLVRLVLAATTDGNVFDLNSYGLVDAALRGDRPLELYGPELYYAPLDAYRWPYPPGFMPVILLVRELADATGIAFSRLIRLPAVAADAAIAWIVFLALRARATDRTAVAGAALVALGPSFVAISGHHGQIDAVAMLPAVLAVWLWERPGVRDRALVCGALIGLGAAIKGPAGIIVLALLVTARTRREALTTLGVAVAIPLAALLPFLIADTGGVRESLGYNGLPGIGGLSVLAQPTLAVQWLTGEPHPPSGLTDALQDLNRFLVLGGLGAAAVVLRRRRASAPLAAAVLVLVVWLTGVNYALGYAVWGLPFLLLAGYVREAAVLQALLLVPTVMVYLIQSVDGWPAGAVYAVYIPLMVLVVAAWVVLLARLLAGRSPQPSAS